VFTALAGAHGWEMDDVKLRALIAEKGRVFDAVIETTDVIYPGGRYLELDRTPTGIYDLDFNRAFHPFCYYNPQYDCPYPPRENRLPVPVRAGEKMGPAGHK
jgi:uncharacterized protein (DUF1684 family)